MEQKIAKLLAIASETHHAVYRKEDGNDPDWATWYSDWLVNHSELPELLNKKIVRSELTGLLVKLDQEYTSKEQSITWMEHYAKGIVSY